MTPQDIVNRLNEAVALDPRAFQSFSWHAVSCNRPLAEASGVAIQRGGESGRFGLVAILGLIVGPEGERIEGVYEPDTWELKGFRLRPKE